MKTLTELLSSWPLPHHAYGVLSHAEDISSLFKDQNQAYIYAKTFDTFKIDDARTIKELQSEKSDEAKIFIIKYTVMLPEAQNALLKVLEEPSENTYFFLVHPHIQQLLPTLLSRLEIITHDDTKEAPTHIIDVQTFITSPLNEQFAMIKEYLESDQEERTKEGIHHFLNALEQHYNHTIPQPFFDILTKARNLLNKNGASQKMILDMVAVGLSSYILTPYEL